MSALPEKDFLTVVTVAEFGWWMNDERGREK